MTTPSPEPADGQAAEPVASAPGQHTVRRGVLLAAGALAAGAVVYTGLATGGADQVPGGTTVLGFPIGDRTDAQASAAMDRHFAQAEAAPLVLSVAGRTVQVNPAEVGLALDSRATVAQATGATWNPASLLHRMVGTSELQPVVTLDRTKLDAVLSGLSARVDTQPQNADIIVDYDGPKFISGARGKEIDREAAAAAIVNSYLRSKEPVALPMTVVPPTINNASAQQVVNQIVKPATAEPITVRAKGVDVEVPVDEIVRVLSFEPQGDTLVPVIDAERLYDSIAPGFVTVEKPGRDATFKIRDGKPVVVPSRTGFGILHDQLGTAFAAALTKSGDQRVVNAPLGTISPAITTEQVKSLGVVEKVSRYRQHFAYAPYRVQNIGQAAKYVNGTLLLPGDVFSMNDTIKERTVENGYTKGFVIGDHGVLKMDEGGGVSTATTAVYNAAWFAGLEFIQHRAHSIYIPRYEPGREATVSWGDFDMKFRNNTDHGIFITTSMEDEAVTVTMYGTKVWDDIGSKFGKWTDRVPYETIYSSGPDCHGQDGIDGFQIDVDRTFYTGDKLIKTERYHTTYKPSPHVICGVDPNASSGGGSDSGGSTPSPSADSGGGGSSSAPAPSPSAT